MNSDNQKEGEVPMAASGTKSGHPNIVLVIIIIIAVVIAGVYLYKHKGASSGNVAETNTSRNEAPRSPYADESFSSAVTITGGSCTMNVCSASGKCTVLTGKTSKTKSCTLDKTQATPEAQALSYIVS